MTGGGTVENTCAHHSFPSPLQPSTEGRGDALPLRGRGGLPAALAAATQAGVRVFKWATGDRGGMTLVEVMVAAFIVAMATITAASIYAGTARRIQCAIAEAEAAALAEAIRVYADETLRAGGMVSDGAWLSQSLSTDYDYFPATMSPVQSALVWQLTVAPHPLTATAGYEKLHAGTLLLARDGNGNHRFDGFGTDLPVSTFVFLLKDP